MNWGQILQNIGIPALVSIFVSGLIALLAYRNQKKIDYIYDYRRYMLDKRKTAYNEAEKVITEAAVYGFLPGTPTEVHAFVFKGDGYPLKSFNEKLVNVIINHGFWINYEFLKELQGFNLFLNSIGKEIQEHNSTDNYPPPKNLLTDAATKHFKEIEIRLKKIHKKYFEEICALDNIKKFKKSKKG